MNAATAPDALVHRLGGLILADATLATLEWESHALVARIEDDALHLAGFAYLHGGDYVALTPDAPELADAVRGLHQAMVDAGADWQACVVRIVRETRKITIEFEYDAPQAWTITPATLADVARRAKPQAQAQGNAE